MEKKDQSRSINSFFRLVNIVPIALLVILLIGVSIFSVTYLRTNNSTFLIILIAYSLLIIGGYVAFVIFSLKKFNELFVNGLYGVTVANFNNILDSDEELLNYPSVAYDEFNALNDTVQSLKTELDYATLIANENDFKHIDLEYLDVDRNVVSLRSLKKNIESIIFASQNYRNVLIELYYELNEDTLTPHETDYLIT